MIGELDSSNKVRLRSDENLFRFVSLISGILTNYMSGTSGLYLEEIALVNQELI